MNDLDHYTHIINGYIGNDDFLRQLKITVEDFKKKNPDLLFVCDPVMGDFGPGWYVPKTLLPIYRNEILPLADVCVPNQVLVLHKFLISISMFNFGFQFEAELLTETKITNETEALEAMNILHDKGVKIVILSSTDFGKADEHQSICLASKRCANGQVEQAKITYPTLPVHFVGTGDLFTALTTAWLHHDSLSITSALEKTIATMQAVLKRTLTSARAAGGDNPSPAQLELKLIQSRHDILEPKVEIKASQLT